MEVAHVLRSFPLRDRLVPVVLALLLLPGRVETEGNAPDAGGAAPRITLFVTADLRGQLTPCGCTLAMRGGLARAAAMLARERTAGVPVVYLDGGDALFGRGGLGPEEVVEEERKARALAEALRTMGIDVQAPGPLDDVQGPAFRRRLDLPELAPGAGRLLRAGGRTLGVVAARSAAELSRGGSRLRQAGAAFVVGLYAGPLDQAVSSVRGLDSVDLVVAAQDPAPASESDDGRLVRADVPVARLPSRGRALLRVDLVFDGAGRFRLERSPEDVERQAAVLDERIALLTREVALPGQDPERRRLLVSRLGALVEQRAALAPAPPLAGMNGFTVRLLPLESTLPSDPAVDAVVSAFDRDVSALNLAWARAHGRDCPPPDRGEAAYVGNAACQSCHAAAFAVYERTGHARAYRTLEEVQKQYRLECVACHVVGIQQPGGVCRVDRVSGRDAVGCENCHGPGSLHVAQPAVQPMGRTTPDRAVCTGCHTPENSPQFDLGLYLPRVLGPGHGAKR